MRATFQTQSYTLPHSSWSQHYMFTLLNPQCYTYVRACVEGARRKLSPAEVEDLWPIFVQPSGEPLNIFFHESVNDKPAIRMKITQCGGKRVAHIDASDIILIEKPAHEDEEEEYRALMGKHAIDPQVRVENPSWIDDCMEARRLVQHSFTINYGSRKASTSRCVIPFTLCKFY